MRAARTPHRPASTCRSRSTSVRWANERRRLTFGRTGEALVGMARRISARERSETPAIRPPPSGLARFRFGPGLVELVREDVVVWGEKMRALEPGERAAILLGSKGHGDDVRG